MYEQVEKSKANKSRSVANFVAQKKGNGKQGFGFVDNRPKPKNEPGILKNQPVIQKTQSALVKLYLRASAAFVPGKEGMPLLHVFLTAKDGKKGQEIKVAERGAGSEDWKSVSRIMKETLITRQQMALIREKNQKWQRTYKPWAYIPFMMDCHNWIEDIQKEAGIQDRLSTSHFDKDVLKEFGEILGDMTDKRLIG